MYTVARRSSTSTTMRFSDRFSAAPSFLLLLFFVFFLLILPSSLSAAAAADHQSGDATTTARPLLQRPSLSLHLALSVPDEMKARPLDSIINLPLPQATEQQYPHQQGASLTQAKGSAAVRGRCTYTVTIKTSCSSPRVTRDAVSLTFGDVYRNEVYVARLDDPASGTFERCSTDTFRIAGPCGGRTCYLYLYRHGRDGWTPDYVKVYYNPRDPHAAVTFTYKVPIPDSVWYGFNLCHAGTVAIPTTRNEATADAHGSDVAATTTMVASSR